MVNDCADALRQYDRRASSGDIGAEARDERLTAGVKQLRCGRGRSVQFRRRAIDPGMVHCDSFTPGSRSAVVLDVSKTLVAGWRPFERASRLCGLPMDNLLDLFRQFEILVGYALGCVILQAHFDPC